MPDKISKNKVVPLVVEPPTQEDGPDDPAPGGSSNPRATSPTSMKPPATPKSPKTKKKTKFKSGNLLGADLALASGSDVKCKNMIEFLKLQFMIATPSFLANMSIQFPRAWWENSYKQRLFHW